ncbi:MAG: PAS domain S-box protein [Chitinophagaceae bacterium]
MKFNFLLEKQLQDLLPDTLRNSELLQPFLRAVNDSYNAGGQPAGGPQLISMENDRLSSLILNFQGGILLDENGRIVLTNQFFCNLFGLIESPGELAGLNSTWLAEQSKHLFKHPEAYVRRIEELVASKTMVVEEGLELADGRIFERDCIPVFAGNEYKGHLWKYCDVTNRRKAEAELKASEERWQFALEGAGDGLWEYNFQTHETYFSKQYKKMLGYEEEEFLNTVEEWSDRIHPDDMPIIRQTDKDYLTGTITSHQREYRMRHKDGHYRWILDRGMIITNTTDGKPLRIIGTHTDITDRKKTEQELKHLSLVASANENAVLLTDGEGKIYWANDNFIKITGYAPQEVIGKTPIELFKGPLSDKATISRILEAFTTGRSFRAEVIYYRKDGSPFWGRTKGQPIVRSKTQGLQYFGIIEDISTEKKQEEEIQRLSMIASSSTAGIIIFDPERKVSWCNTSFEQLTGYSLDDMRGKEIFPFAFGPKTDEDAIKRMWQQGEHHRNFNDEFIHYRKDGSYFHAAIKMQFVKDKSGNVIQEFAIIRDITAEKEAQKKLTEVQQVLRINEEKYRNIITNMNLGLLEVDNDGVIMFANRRFCEISGYEAREIIGRDAGKLLAPVEGEELLKLKTELRKKGISDTYEIAVRNKKGEPRWWLISAAPRYNDKGDIVGSIGIHLDITTQKELQQQLHDALEAAENSAKAKELFLANMSHEIRTPMNAILGMSRQLYNTRLDEEQQLFLDTITKAAENLLIVINDILDMSKIEAGKLSLEQIGFRPKEMIHHCLRVMQYRADEKDLQLVKEFDPAISPVLIGDPHRMNQVLLNLISNSIKFTEKGGVTVACSLLETNNNQQTLRFSIRDTGIGMDEDFQAILFQKFTQEDRTIARKYGGTGLGMSISRQLIGLMNGTIDVKSKKGTGTEIILTIPFTIGSTDDLPVVEKNAMDHSILKGKNILLAEDNELNRFVATTILKKYGVRIGDARNGQEAVNAIATGGYDLVLMDVQMPGMDGLEATRTIRATGNNIPIIALTANAIKGESDRCREAGMNDYISKPFEEEQLVILMSHWMAEKNNVTPEKEKKAAAGSPLYDLSHLRQFSDDPAFITEMTGLFIDEATRAVQEIVAARDQGDLATVRSAAHRIKPSIDSMAINSLHDVIRAIEKAEDHPSARQALDQDISTLQQVMEEVIGQLKAGLA